MGKKQFFIFLFLAACSSYISAQSTFEQTFFTADVDSEFSGDALIQSADGGFIIAGTRNQYHPDAFPIEGGWYWLMVAKTDAMGDTLWTKEFPTIQGRNLHLIELTDQSILLIHNVDGGLTCDGFFVTFPPYPNLALLKLDAAGNEVFNMPFVAECGQSLLDMRLVADGFIVLLKDDHLSFTDDQYLLRKYDFSGNLQWENSYDGGLLLSSFELISDTEFFLLGRTFNVPGADNNLLKLVKTNSSGTVLDEIIVGDLVYNYRYKILKGTDDQYVIASYYSLYDYLNLTKIDETGTIIWRKNYSNISNNAYRNISSTSDNGYLLLRHIDQDVYITKINASGNALWTQNYDSGALLNDFPQDIIETADGNWAVVGTAYCCDINIGMPIPAGVYLIKGSDVVAEVWAGDANFDGIVNMDDLLALGLSYGTTGSTRPGASLDWEAQAATDWVTSFTDMQFNGINHKHADCDGNGTVEEADTLAISLNYDLTHAKDEEEESIDGIPLFWEVADTILTGAEYAFAIHLGNTDTIAEDIYGIRFTAEFAIADDLPDTLQVNSPFAGFNASWLGTKSVNMLTLDTAFTQNLSWDVALTRNDQNEQTGFGELCRLICVMDVGSLKTAEEVTLPIQLSFKNVKIIRLDGSEVDVNPQSTTTLLSSNTTSLQPTLPISTWQLYPNPSTDKLFLKGQFAPHEMLDIQIVNAKGQVVLNNTLKGAAANALSLDISHLAAGLYYVEVNNGQTVDFKKIAVVK